jgi:Carboxypeptidase regulatory-like domain
MADVKFKLMPFAVIAGSVRESDGEPITGAWITLLRLYHRAEGSSLERAVTAQTDDLGQFRIPDLAPGKYFARASPSPSSPNENAEDHGGKDTPHETLVGVMYGGSRGFAGARSIEVEPGARISGIDFVLTRSHIFHVRGHVTSPAGTHARVSLSSGGVNDGVGEGFNGVLKENGDFDIPGVPTGSYTSRADARKRNTDQPADGRVYIDFYEPLHATTPVEVGGRDIDGLRITVEDGAEVTGHISVIGERDVTLSGWRVVFHGSYENYSRVYVKPDQTFSVTLAPDRYEVLVENSDASKKRVIRSIRSADVDVLRDGFTIQGPGAVPIEIILAPDAGELDGTALDKDGNPAPGATVRTSRRGLKSLVSSAVSGSRPAIFGPLNRLQCGGEIAPCGFSAVFLCKDVVDLKRQREGKLRNEAVLTAISSATPDLPDKLPIHCGETPPVVARSLRARDCITARRLPMWR